MKEFLNKVPVTPPVDDFDAFRRDAIRKRLAKETRDDSADILLRTSNFAVTSAERSRDFYTIVNAQGLSWKQSILNQDLMTLVRHSTVEEKAILDPTPLPKSKQLEEADRIIKAFEERNRAKEEKAGIKRAPYVPSLAAPAPMLAGADPDARVIIRPGSMSPDKRLSGADPEARVILPPQGKEGKESKEGVKAAKEQELLADVFRKTVTESAPLKMEKISQVLENRKNKSKENLEKMGASWLSKSLEAFKGISPKYKIALGVTLAGASVASGGLTAIVGVMKGLASLSYGSAIYDKMLKAKQDGGFEVNKSALAINSLVLGIGAALATSWIVSEVFSHVDVPKSLEGVKGMVKDWWNGLSEVIPLSTSQLEAMPINGVTMDDGLKINGGVSLAESLSSTESIATPSTSPLATYTIQSGDNLTKIIHEQVLNKIPGVENLTELQKNNIIANLLQQAKENPTNSLYATINQFSNPNIIESGKTLDLNEIRQAITEHHHNLFGGTLLDHAKTITGGSIAGGGYTSSPSFGSVDIEDSTPYSSGKDTEGAENIGSNSATPAETQPLVQQNSTPAPQENPRIRGKGYLTNA